MALDPDDLSSVTMKRHAHNSDTFSRSTLRFANTAPRSADAAIGGVIESFKEGVVLPGGESTIVSRRGGSVIYSPSVTPELDPATHIYTEWDMSRNSSVTSRSAAIQ